MYDLEQVVEVSGALVVPAIKAIDELVASGEENASEWQKIILELVELLSTQCARHPC